MPDARPGAGHWRAAHTAVGHWPLRKLASTACERRRCARRASSDDHSCRRATSGSTRVARRPTPPPAAPPPTRTRSDRWRYAVQLAGHQPGRDRRGCDTERDAGAGEPRSLTDDERDDRAARRADRQPDSKLLRALRNAVADHRVEAERGEREADRREEGQHRERQPLRAERAGTRPRRHLRSSVAPFVSRYLRDLRFLTSPIPPSLRRHVRATMVDRRPPNGRPNGNAGSLWPMTGSPSAARVSTT